MLPFNLVGDLENQSFCRGDLRIPSYGSLTVAESIQIAKIEIDDNAPIGCYYVDVALVLVASRTQHGYGDEAALRDALLQLPIAILEDLVAWVKQESNRWADDPVEADAEKKSLLTGEESIGDLDLLTPLSLDSVPNDLEIARSIS